MVFVHVILISSQASLAVGGFESGLGTFRPSTWGGGLRPPEVIRFVTAFQPLAAGSDLSWSLPSKLPTRLGFRLGTAPSQ